MRLFFTTAQGYRGTYQIVSQLEERRTPHVHVRGLTSENKANDPSYYQDLYDLYSDLEREAYLNGRFVNLATGRVYPSYDESRHLLREWPFQVAPDDEVHIGQDLNKGYSRAQALVKRDGKLYVVKRWSFVEIGHAPAVIRGHFPTQRVLWYPDASGNEIITGYGAEFRKHGIETRISNQNPKIWDRTFFVNKLFDSGSLFLCPGTETLGMALKIRQYDESGEHPVKGKGPDAPDHDTDALEYVTYRIVQFDRDFLWLWRATREGREDLKKKGKEVETDGPVG